MSAVEMVHVRRMEGTNLSTQFSSFLFVHASEQSLQTLPVKSQ